MLLLAQSFSPGRTAHRPHDMDQLLITVETPKDSTILAYGIAPHPRRWGFFALLGLVGAVFIAVLFSWIGFHGTFFIPKNTVFLLAISPNQAQAITRDSTRADLPPAWRAALRPTSPWPVILGASHEPSGWNTFALVPRWKADESLIQEKKGLVALLAETPMQKQDRMLRFTTMLFWRQRFPFANGVFWLDAGSLFARMLPSEDGSHEIIGGFTDRMIRTNLAVREDIFAKDPLFDTDISLNLPRDRALFPPIETMLRERYPDAFFQNELPTSIHIAFTNTIGGQETSFVFKAPIPASEREDILNKLTTQKTALYALPDGAIVHEIRSAPSPSDGDVHTLPEYRGRLLFTDKEIRFGVSTEPFAPIKPTPCGAGSPIMRFSSEVMSRMIREFGFFSTSSRTWPATQVAIQKNHLVICKE